MDKSSQDDDSDLRKASGIGGKRKQYSGPEDRGIISETSGRFLPEKYEKFSDRNIPSMKSTAFPGNDRFFAVLGKST